MVEDNIDNFLWYKYPWIIEEEKPESKNHLNKVLLIEEEEKSVEQYEKTRTPLNSFFLDRIYPLKKEIGELKKEIDVRFRLNSQFLEEINHQILMTETSLKEFSFWGVGYNTGVDVKRNHLERELSDLRRERRNTKLRCWDDIIALRRELRGKMAEYKMITSKEKIVKLSNDR